MVLGRGGRAYLADEEGIRPHAVGQVLGATGAFVGTVRWLPGDLGLVAPLGDRAEWVHQRDGEWVTERLPALDGPPVELALVIQQ